MKLRISISFIEYFKHRYNFLRTLLIYIERNLFNYMKHNKIMAFNKLILQRKFRSTLNVSSVGGKNKKIQIEVRKKRTYVQCFPENIDNNVNAKNDVACNIDNKLTTDAEFVKNELVIDKEVNSVENLSKSLKDLLLQNNNNNNCPEFLALQKTVSDDEINYSVEKKIKKIQDKMLFVSEKKNEECDRQKCVDVLDKNVNKKNFDSKLRYVPVLEKKDDEKKLENERRHRVRMRAKYRFSGNNKSIKQKRSNNNYRYNVAGSISDDVDSNEKKNQLYFFSNRINKNKRKQNNNTVLLQSFNKPIQKVVHNIIIGETISVSELANKMSIKGSYVVKTMTKLGLITSIDQIIDQETAQLVVEEMGHNVVLRHENALEKSIINDRNNNIKNNGSSILALKKRAPVVTVMGHVDHGKTSLLDCIRSTKIASSETGGITQSIGAYHVNINNNMITFIDTPGHAAFTSMRARGVQLTDIVVLVIAADDGIMPQTIESIKYVKSANVPVVVAINKIDKLGVNPEKIKNDLAKYDIISEKWGGDVQFVNVSAISGIGINSLLDAILLQSEMLELKVTHHGLANAIVIDSFVDKGRGPVVTVLVREGTLKCGDVILCGTEYGRIRAMRDEFGCNVVSVGPSVPVELLGLSGIPIAGEIAIVVRDEKKAREVAFYRKNKCREVKLARRSVKNNLDNVFVDVKNNNVILPELHLIIKANTQGAIEAINESLMSLSTDKIIIKILSSSIGSITETDVVLAATSNAIVLGFNVRADVVARRIIASEGLDVRYYSVIYNLINEVKQAIKGMLIPKNKYKVIGLAEVRDVFCSPKYGNIAGCIVIEGIIKRYKKVKVIRNNIVIYSGELDSLRRFKNDVNEVRSGVECGIGIKNYDNISSGDVIEVFDIIKEPIVSSGI